jgi:hypothetical protein
MASSESPESRQEDTERGAAEEVGHGVAQGGEAMKEGAEGASDTARTAAEGATSAAEKAAEGAAPDVTVNTKVQTPVFGQVDEDDSGTTDVTQQQTGAEEEEQSG